MPLKPASWISPLAALLATGLAAQSSAPAAGAPGSAPDLQSKTLSLAAEDKPIPLSKVAGQIRVFVLEDIQRSGARNLGEFLAGEMPAEYAQQGGPGLPTQAYQGGARPQDTLVMLDGVRINDPGQTGTDLT
ncbi:MAG TPA: TonB-dependent receptor plug domain-containing protein, partial [Holophagaceae bacterium]|nr:TonB-dependent receptor plug domain-containing protein [Holophagaceae bacterium]